MATDFRNDAIVLALLNHHKHDFDQARKWNNCAVMFGSMKDYMDIFEKSSVAVQKEQARNVRHMRQQMKAYMKQLHKALRI